MSLAVGSGVLLWRAGGVHARTTPARGGHRTDHRGRDTPGFPGIDLLDGPCDRPGPWAAMSEPRPPARRHTFRERVLHAFVADGRLVRIPARERKRLIVLQWIANTDFEPGREYLERDIDMRLASRHPDVAALRRYLVEGRYLSRAGGVYRLRPEADWPTDPEADAPSPESMSSASPRE